MAGDLGPRHREAHVGEQAARTALADVPLGLLVRLGGRRADDVDPELLQALELCGGQPQCPRKKWHRAGPRLRGAGHARMRPRDGGSSRSTRSIAVKAIRIHEDGGPEVLRYEDAPDPEPGPGEVLVELRAASLNRLDLWVRKGLPSVPKPRILGADGAGSSSVGGRRRFEPASGS